MVKKFKEATCEKCLKIFKISLYASANSYKCEKCSLKNHVCEFCGKKFKNKKERQYCSPYCQKLDNQKKNPGMASKGGIISAKNRCIRSKDEIKLYELCVKNFNYEITHNEEVIHKFKYDADIIIRDLKIAILWNGIWHYKELGFTNYSLEEIKKRDNKKIEFFYENGWDVFIFEDHIYNPENAFKILDKFIKEKNV